jgi:hypothetical protein
VEEEQDGPSAPPIIFSSRREVPVREGDALPRDDKGRALPADSDYRRREEVTSASATRSFDPPPGATPLSPFMPFRRPVDGAATHGVRVGSFSNIMYEQERSLANISDRRRQEESKGGEWSGGGRLEREPIRFGYHEGEKENVMVGGRSSLRKGTFSSFAQPGDSWQEKVTYLMDMKRLRENIAKL